MATTPVEVKKIAPAHTAAIESWQSFRTEMDRLFDRFSSGFRLPSLERLWDTSLEIAAPAVDVSEDDKAFTVTAELPGLTEKEVAVTVANGVLTIKGEKKKEEEKREKNYYLSERSYGSFQRSFALPDAIEANKITAEFSKGVLTVTLPKSAEAQTEAKKIDIKAA